MVRCPLTPNDNIILIVAVSYLQDDVIHTTDCHLVSWFSFDQRRASRETSMLAAKEFMNCPNVQTG